MPATLKKNFCYIDVQKDILRFLNNMYLFFKFCQPGFLKVVCCLRFKNISNFFNKPFQRITHKVKQQLKIRKYDNSTVTSSHNVV